jgi:hypothetical protein
MDFANVTYAIVFNVNPSAQNSGTQNMPYANVFASGFQNYSYAFVIGGQYGAAYPTLLQYYVNPGTPQLQINTVVPTPSLTVFTPNDNGLNNEFTLIFDRLQLNLAPPIPTSSPSLSAFPTPTPTGSTAPTPTPAPGQCGDVTPCYFGSVWYYNFFTLGGNSSTGFYAIDALGTGPKDTSAVYMVDVTADSNNAINVPAGYNGVSNVNAQITGGQFNNYL